MVRRRGADGVDSGEVDIERSDTSTGRGWNGAIARLNADGRRKRAFCAGPWGGIVLVLIALAVWLPGFFTLPAIDRDECRFAQASRQMMTAPDWHGWLVPMVQDRPRLNKPPLIYWLQASSAAVCTGRWFGVSAEEALARDAIWMYRIPSLLAALVAVLATWRLGTRMFEPRVGYMAALMLAFAPVVVWEVRQARADMVLLACTTLAVWALWSCWKSWRDVGRVPLASVLGLWVGVGLGVLDKGPVTPLVIAMSAVLLAVITRSWNWIWRLRPLLGVVIVVGMILPWVVLVANDIGWSTYLHRIYDETIGRSLEAKEGHGGPPGYHLLFTVPLLGAASLAIGLAVWRALLVGWPTRAGEGGSWFARARARLNSVAAGRDAECFLLCVIVPTWVFMEAIGTKLPHYTLPLYPALCLLAARAVHASWNWSALPPTISKVVDVLVRAWTILPLVLMMIAAGVTALVIGRWWGRPVGVAALTLGVASAAYGWWRLWRCWGRRDLMGTQRAGLLAVGVAMGFATAALAQLREITISSSISRSIAMNDPRGELPIITIGYVEDSLIFETKGRIKRLNELELIKFVRQHPPTRERQPVAIFAMHEAQVYRWAWMYPFAGIEGFNYSRGKVTRICVGFWRPPMGSIRPIPEDWNPNVGQYISVPSKPRP